MTTRRSLLPTILALGAFALTLWTVPAWWCRQGSGPWFAGDQTTQDRLAATVALQVQDNLSTADFHTQSTLFDGEWLFGTHLMAGIAFCQIIQQHPEDLEKWRPTIESSIHQILSPEVRAFDQRAWDSDPIDSLETPDGHAAYLGYLNFLLSLYRTITPENPFAELNDAITRTLIRRSLESPNGLIATYPGEWYPVDNSPGIASVALHGQATGTDHSAFLNSRRSLIREHLRDRNTGLLYQAMNADGSPRDLPRGSGTALSVFFLSRAYPDLTADLFGAIQKHLAPGLFQFGAIREYPRGLPGRSDIDSGPIIFGFGFSATGFSIGGARAVGDAGLYARLYASAILAGAPSRADGRTNFLTAGPLGNAILLAMLTTPEMPK